MRKVRCLQRLVGRAVGAAVLLTLAAGSAAQAQVGADAIYGVTSLDVAASAAAQGVAILKQYRDAARKQAGNFGVELLQEVGGPNRFIIHETWKDQSAYDANEKSDSSISVNSDALPPEFFRQGPEQDVYRRPVSIDAIILRQSDNFP